MDVQEILDDLSYFDGLPREALAAASERRTELVAPLIDAVENAARDPEGVDPASNLVFFAFHLLGEWRETSAYRPLTRLLRLDAGKLLRVGIASTDLTATAHRVIAGVFDGDPQPLLDLIYDDAADEFMRSRMWEALAMAVLAGRFPRDRAIDLLRDAYPRLQPWKGYFVWHGWQQAIAALGAQELEPLVKAAFETELIAPEITEFKYFRNDLALALRNPEAPWPNASEYELWGSSIEEFSTWTFSPGGDSRAEYQPTEDAGTLVWSASEGSYLNPHRDVGRNDPCHCGSGKKYKKCCLAADEDGALTAL